MSARNDTTLRVYDAIRQLSSEHRRPPTHQQVADAAGLKYRSGVWFHLRKLRAAGLVAPSDGRAGILLTEEHTR